MTGVSTSNRARIWLAVCLIILMGAFFRFYDLSLCALRGDTIIFWGMAVSKVSAGDILTKWKEVSGNSSQMPLPAVIMQAFLHVFSQPVTLTTVRIPFAFMGTISILVAFLGARKFAGVAAGLLFAAILALDPFHIQYSREVYAYSSTLMGYLFYFWAVAEIMPTLRSGSVVTAKQLIILSAGLFFSGFSQMTGLIICSIGVPFWAVLLWLRRDDKQTLRKNAVRLLATHAVILSPHLFVSWGPRTMLAEYASGFSAVGAKVSAMSGETMFSLLGNAATQYTWGTSTAGLIILALALIGFALVLAKLPREQLWVLGYFILAPVLMYWIARSFFGTSYEARYIASIFPFYLMALTLGLLGLAQAIRARLRPGVFAVIAASAVPLAACGALIYPAYLSCQITGAPAPYRQIVDWLDKNLPASTPVLVDRWFEPWNELKWTPSTNVIFTFTIPNEPVDVFLKYNWRNTAKDFFAKYPDAAYLEMWKEYWEVPAIGSWKWPREYFARHVAFTNEPGLKLRHLGLATRGDFYRLNTNGVIVELFYNTVDDVLEKAKAGGQSVVALYGPGWGYTKLWQQINDYRDWRVLQKQAAIDVYNLTSEPMNAGLRITAVALGGVKRVNAGSQVFDFQGNQIMEWTLPPVTLQPGMNRIELTDSIGDQAKPLLVADIQVAKASP